MPMVSYAQNGEDVVLARLFDAQESGHYIDVGAWDPVVDSVTKHFYDRGWRGVNVEPHPASAARLRAERPEDLTLELALSRRAGWATLHVDRAGRTGLSTLDRRTAGRVLEGSGEPFRVRTATLAAVVAEHAPWPVDFLKVDVEGHERAVLAGADWARFRPRVVVVEATQPNSAVPSHRGFEPLLTAAGYRCVLFDGLNRFYARAGDREARRVLATPANVLDDWVRHDLVAERDRAGRLEEVRAALERRCSELEAQLAAAAGAGAGGGAGRRERPTSLGASKSASRPSTPGPRSGSDR